MTATPSRAGGARPSAERPSAADGFPLKADGSPIRTYPHPNTRERDLCPRSGCGRLASAPCEDCRQFLAACEHHAAGAGPAYGGRVLLELVRQAAQSIACGRTAEGAATLRALLAGAGMEAHDNGASTTARRSDVRLAVVHEDGAA